MFGLGLGLALGLLGLGLLGLGLGFGLGFGGLGGIPRPSSFILLWRTTPPRRGSRLRLPTPMVEGPRRHRTCR